MSRNFRSLLVAATALGAIATTPVSANPLAPNVVGGSATVTGTGTSTVTVTQSTEKAIINWNTFNIGSGETTRFLQPGSSSIALNRVTGGLGASTIFGMLTANGRIFLVNPDGILFGGGATINTGGFLATTHDIKNEDFMAGRYVFGIPGRPDASIVNLGTITAQSGGFAALVAPGVRNTGIISATLGTVGLAAGNGFTLDFYGDSLISLAIGDKVAANVKDVATGQPLTSLIKNDGKLSANGGRVELTAAAAREVVDAVINTSGVIEANAIGTRNGMIVLSAATAASKPSGTPTQTVKVSGTLSAAGKAKGEIGGKIQITGEAIEVTGAQIDVSGRSGGGHVLIGGDVAGGKGSPLAALEPLAVPTATSVTVDQITVIDASARDTGNGGKVVLWADQVTKFYGTVLARGGALSGNGGFVETSGHLLDVNGAHVDTSAASGATGTWLLDPFNLVVDIAAAATISTNLATTNVNLLTTATTTSGPGTAVDGAGDILVDASIFWNSANALSFSAYRNIVFGPGVVIANTGAGSLTLRSDNTGTGTGGVFFNPSFGAPSLVDFSQSTGTVSIFYNTDSVISVQTNPAVANQLLLNLYAGQAIAAYMTGMADPWSIAPSDPGSPDAAMNAAFGSGNWTKFYGFNTAVLNGAYKMVYMDGGAAVASEFNSFVGSNVASLQSFVNSGGALFLNAARWTGGTDPSTYQSGVLDVGFGTKLTFDESYALAFGTGNAVDPSNPIFNGPVGSAGTTWTGNYFSHDTVTSGTLQPLITGTFGDGTTTAPILVGGTFGSGYVLVGGMTSPFFQSPSPQAENLRANILGFAASQSTIAAPGQTPPPPPPPPQLDPPIVLANLQTNFFTAPPNPPNNNLLEIPDPTSSPGGSGPADHTGSIGGRTFAQLPPEPTIPNVPPPGENRFVSNEVVFQVGPNVTRQQVEGVAQRLSLAIIDSQILESLGSTVYRFRYFDNRNVRDVIRSLEASGLGGQPQPNYQFKLAQTASVGGSVAPADSNQYVINKLLLSDVHRISNGNNVAVAVIDSAIDAKHPELSGVVAEHFDATGVTDTPDTHGTGIAGAIAAHQKLKGVAPRARLLAITAFSPKTGSSEATTLQILRGFDWAVRKGAKVINMSFAGPPDPGLQRALNAARAKGIILIAAAGNAGPKSPPLYPAANRSVIAVTATDADDRLFPGSNRGRHIAVAAPGVDILLPAPNGKYQVTTGTSFAAAHVSGIVALLLARDPTLKPDDVRMILTGTAKDLGPKGFDTDYGSGLVDTYKALTSLERRSVEAPAGSASRRTR